VLAIGLAVVVLVGLGCWMVAEMRRRGRAPVTAAPPDPRLSYSGPYRNVHPDVPYVGDDHCAGCHPTESNSYRHHPMGRSLTPIAELAPRQVYDTAHRNPFQAFGSTFLVERAGGRVWHREVRRDAADRPIYTSEHEVHYAIGSGRRGYSYVTNQDGYLFQTPISWFAQKQVWDVSPGFSPGQLRGRPLSGDCLFCHANRAHPLQSYQNRYEQPVFTGHAIGCERCHGPGGRHVQSADVLDIVNPGKLQPALRDDVCAQCHLEGEVRLVRRGRGLYDFRPGLPLAAFWSVFVLARAPGDSRAVNHFEQMHHSACFRRTSGPGKLGCVSCHDPHVAVGPERRLSYYRDRCLKCHQEAHCREAPALRHQKQDSCIACHMPPYAPEDIAHTATTDHRIVRVSRPESEPGGPRPTDEGALVPFGHDRLDPEDSDLGRDLGMALVVAATRAQLPPARASARGFSLLRAALKEWPGDVEAWEGCGSAQLVRQQWGEALTHYEEALARDPHRERSLLGAALAAEQLGLVEHARDYWRRAVAANPWLPEYRRGLSLLLLRQRDLEEAGRQAQQWLRLDPGSVEARRLWITYLVQKGKSAEARAEFARIEALRPANLDELRHWFASQAH
jgi:tetratricopeptide (TPR) repeat protein